jgi:hypothetical protein
MRDFFGGWRRKAGVVTLVMACAVMWLWWRSWTTADYFRFKIGDRQHRISSTNEDGLAWESWNSLKPWNEEIVPLVKQRPHLMVAFPLLGISVYLILWKPRKRASPN